MNAPSKDKSGKQLSDSSVKWIVIGIIVLIFIFLFHSKIGHFLDRVSGVKLTDKGVEITTHHTPVGEILVSNTTVGRLDVPDAGLRDNSYVSTQYGFVLSWPKGWRPSERMEHAARRLTSNLRSIDIPLVISKKFGRYTPNVIVSVQSGVRITIAEYIERNMRDVERRGSIIHSFRIDNITEGGLVVSSTEMMGHSLYNIQRYAIADGIGYILTASSVPPTNRLSDDLKQELLAILNSFRLIR